MPTVHTENSTRGNELFENWIVPTDRVGNASELVFFNTALYEGKNIPYFQFREEVFTYFAEHLRRPTKRVAYWDGTHWSHADGTHYDDMFDQAIASVDDGDVRLRFAAEGKGWQNGGELANQLKNFVIISLPGNVYRNPGYGAKNMTYYARAVGKANGIVTYEILSIPSRELTAAEHAAAALSVVGEVSETDPNWLVSHPLPVAVIGNLNELQENLDTMAEKLDYADFAEIEMQAEKTLEAENDPLSTVRREQMVDYFAAAMHDAQSNVFLTPEIRQQTLKVLGDMMHYYFSLEAGSEFAGKEFSQVENLIAQHITDALMISTMDARSQSFDVMSEAEKLAWWECSERNEERMSVLRANEKAYDSYQVTGCAISFGREDGLMWNTALLNPLEQNQRDSLFQGDVSVGYEDSPIKSSDDEKTVSLDGTVYTLSQVKLQGEKACYHCPVCQKEAITSSVFEFKGYMVCESTPEEHHIKKN